MKKETLKQHLFEHGRLTAYAKGERQVIWGVITDVNGVDITIVNHENEKQKFEYKAIKGFRKENFDITREVPKLKCDCGCTSDGRYICERCGKTFCGLKHGTQERDSNNKNLDLCDKCTKIVEKERL